MIFFFFLRENFDISRCPDRQYCLPGVWPLGKKKKIPTAAVTYCLISQKILQWSFKTAKIVLTFRDNFNFCTSKLRGIRNRLGEGRCVDLWSSSSGPAPCYNGITKHVVSGMPQAWKLANWGATLEVNPLLLDTTACGEAPLFIASASHSVLSVEPKRKQTPYMSDYMYFRKVSRNALFSSSLWLFKSKKKYKMYFNKTYYLLKQQ